uniref:Uncharacterized protein n=1 Tax=Varanus komodoensis TaxID=61221 RepID=A0A8D2L462_VARKO
MYYRVNILFLSGQFFSLCFFKFGNVMTMNLTLSLTVISTSLARASFQCLALRGVVLSGKGTGQGLAVTLRSVQALDGSVESCESRARTSRPVLLSCNIAVTHWKLAGIGDNSNSAP